jgi:hypothetical protein
MATNKVMCEECNWHGTFDQVLHGKNPFAKGEEIIGCPECHAPEMIICVCEIDKCRLPASCGTPLSDGGYAQTCGKHVPNNQVKADAEGGRALNAGLDDD